MAVRASQLLTAFAIVVAATPAIALGWQIFGFSLADSVINEAVGPSAQQIQAVHPWLEVPGLRFAARASFLPVVSEQDPAGTAASRSKQLAEILSVKPLSSKHWLLLAEIKSVTHQPPADIAEAIKLSVLTGPNEGFLIGRRGLFGLSQWELLPPELRTRAAADLVANPDPLSGNQMSWLRHELTQKSAPVRQDIRTALLAQGFPEKRLADIGF